MSLSFLSTFLLAIPGLALFYRFVVMTEPRLEITYPLDDHTRYRLRRRRKLSRISFALLIAASLLVLLNMW